MHISDRCWKNTVLLCYLLCVWGGYSFAQTREVGHPHITNFSFKDYKARSTNFAVAQDPRGIIYVGNMSGVLEFDGANWTQLSVVNESPVRSLAIDTTGHVYIGGSGDFGYLAPDSAGQLSYVSLWNEVAFPLPQGSDVVNVLGTSAGAFYYFSGQANQLFYWDGVQLQHWSLPETFKAAHLHMNDDVLWASVDGKGLFKWRERSFQPWSDVPAFQKHDFRQLVDWNKDLLLGFDGKQNRLYLIPKDGNSPPTPFRIEGFAEVQRAVLTQILVLRDKKLLLGTRREGAFIFEPNGKLVQQINHEIGLQDDFVIGATQDAQGNVWLAMSKGISYIEIASPISRFGANAGLRGLVFSARRFQDQLYASTSLGVFSLKEQSFSFIPPLQESVVSMNEVWVRNSKGTLQSHLVIHADNGLLYKVDKQRVAFLEGTVRCIRFAASKAWPGYMFVNDQQQRFLMLKYNNGKWEQVGTVSALAGKYALMEPGNGQELWLLDQYGGGKVKRIRWKGAAEDGQVSVRVFGVRDNLPEVNKIFSFRGETLFSTTEGLYRFDSTRTSFQPFSLSEVDRKGIFHLVEDQLGNVWITRTYRKKNTARGVKEVGKREL